MVVRSVSTATSTPAGNEARSDGSNSWMLSTTSMTFAPGCRCTLINSAGEVFIHAASRVFSALSVSSATSPSRTGAPFLYATTMLRYSAALFS